MSRSENNKSTRILKLWILVVHVLGSNNCGFRTKSWGMPMWQGHQKFTELTNLIFKRIKNRKNSEKEWKQKEEGHQQKSWEPGAPLDPVGSDGLFKNKKQSLVNRKVVNPIELL